MVLLQQLLAFGLLLCKCHAEALRAATGPIVLSPGPSSLMAAFAAPGSLKSTNPNFLDLPDSSFKTLALLILPN